MGTRFGIGTGIILAVLVIPLGMAAAGSDSLRVTLPGLNFSSGVVASL
jgi:hypothetical protein